MSIIFVPDCISCCFESDYKMVVSKDTSNKLEVFYAQTKDLSSGYSNLQNYITNDEQIKADKFHFDKDRETYISCHALLRLILSKRLNISPLELSFNNTINNKSCLTGNPVYFNISNASEAFAFAISRDFYVGIDLENVNQRIDFNSIIETFFTDKEREYILGSQFEARDRFFFLWTRKEALLKAIGTGILTDCKQVEVYKEENVPEMKSIDNLILMVECDKHFIYSKKLSNYFLSIATPQMAKIILNQINSFE